MKTENRGSFIRILALILLALSLMASGAVILGLGMFVPAVGQYVLQNVWIDAALTSLISGTVLLAIGVGFSIGHTLEVWLPKLAGEDPEDRPEEKLWETVLSAIFDLPGIGYVLLLIILQFCIDENDRFRLPRIFDFQVVRIAGLIGIAGVGISVLFANPATTSRPTLVLKLLTALLSCCCLQYPQQMLKVIKVLVVSVAGVFVPVNHSPSSPPT